MKRQEYVQMSGSRLRALRLDRRLRQADLAALAGIDTSYLCMLETGRRGRASLAVATALANALDVELPSIIVKK
ncbi:helix-turn-helix domain-containing protein [Spirillospora sp. NPDC050679]